MKYKPNDSTTVEPSARNTDVIIPKTPKKSKFTKTNVAGVTREPNNRWRARINGLHIGIFSTKYEAIDARVQAEDIYEEILSHLDIVSVKFIRSESSITLEATTKENRSILVPFSTGGAL